MAENFKDPKKLFDPQNLSEANSAIRNLADNANNLKKVSEEFGDTFGRSFVNKINQVSRDFDNIAARASDFQKLDVTKSEAMRMQKKLAIDLANLALEEKNLKTRVEGTLKNDYDKSKEIFNIAESRLATLVESGRASKKQLTTAEARKEAAEKILKADKGAYELGQAALSTLQESLRRGEKLVEQTGDYVANWNKARLASGLLGRALTGLKKIPFVGDIIDADTMLNVMNKSLIDSDGLFKAFGKGVSAAFKGIEKSTIILALIGAVVKAIKFVISLAFQAQEQVVAIAKNLGITQKSAGQIADRFGEIAYNSRNLKVNIKSLTEAQADFTKSVGAATIMSDDLLESQVFLKKNLGLSGEQASTLGQMFNIMGENANNVVSNVIDTNNATAETQGYLIPTNVLMSKIASAGAELSTYFGNNVRSLAEGVRQVTKFGLELQQAASISKSLLDFESSIANELNAEILLGKDFNFERVRSLALQGKFGDATEEVMSQMQNLTEEQRRNPIYLEAAAKAAGLSTEELAKSYQIQKNLNMSAQEYGKLQARAGAIGKEALLERLGLQGASQEQIEKTLSAQEAFADAMDKAREQFARLVGSGVIEKLVELLPKVVTFISNTSGMDYMSKEAKEQALTKGKSLTDEDFTKMGVSKRDYDSLLRKATLDKGMFGLTSNSFLKSHSAFTTNKGIDEARAELQALQGKLGKKDEIEAEDFTIRTHPKDTLVMAGGTQLGGGQSMEEVVKSVNRLTAIVEKGGNVYINGNDAGKALVLGTSRLS